jgi:hypothetical protein
LEDTFINQSYLGDFYTATETENFNFGEITNNCTCIGTGTNKEYHYGLNCDIGTDCNMTGGNISWTGSGTWTCHAEFWVCRMDEPTSTTYIGGNCTINIGAC